MLETIRTYAAERLTVTAGHDRVRERHYGFYLALAQQHGTERALKGVRRKEHRGHLDADHDNLQVALAWALDQRDAEPALAIVAALGEYWLSRDRFADAMYWIDRALSKPCADAHPGLCFRALRVKVFCLGPLGRGVDEPAAIAQAEAIAGSLRDPVILSQACGIRAHHEALADRPDVANKLADEALSWAIAAGDAWQIAVAHRFKADAPSTIAELRDRVDLAATLLDEVGNIDDRAILLASAAYTALCHGSDRDAKEFVDRATPIVRELDSPYLWMLLRGNFGLAALLTGDTDAAQDAFREELTLCRELVLPRLVSEGPGFTRIV
jgi:hypothetical protein